MVDWVRLELHVDTFDDAAFEPRLDRARESGITFTTMAELGDTPAHRRALYDLNRTCAADIPDRGAFYTYDELATLEGEWIGMSTTSLHPDEGYAFSEMTGVLAPHRGRGLSLALKLLAIRFVRSAGYERLITFHHPRNTSAIAMNRRLGFVDPPAERQPG
jgi:GNAT superfamily N-acetyltransferase